MTGLLLLSVLLGGLVGWERERHERPAGLRTHILVCLGAALITLVSNGTLNGGGRIAAQIVTGVGFLGAGTILRDTDGAVRGLTTAASLWAMAGVGIAVGTGGLFAQVATVTTLIVLLCLTVVNRLEGNLNRHRKRQALTLILTTECDALPAVSRLLAAMRAGGVRTHDLRLESSLDSIAVRLTLRLPNGESRDALDTLLAQDRDVLHHDWAD